MLRASILFIGNIHTIIKSATIGLCALALAPQEEEIPFKQNLGA
jgi:uncharacterized membrane protein